MPSVRLATWNVNSIRSRAERVAAWLERRDVDVLALQETKCRDDQFPEMPFQALGYEVAHVGWPGKPISTSSMPMRDSTATPFHCENPTCATS